jgi:uncharacterized lipoprotein YmbA
MRALVLRGASIVVLPVTFALGCFGGGRPSEFFTLSPTTEAGDGVAIASRPHLGLAVGPLQFPRYLDRPEIVVRDGANRLVFAEYHRWGGSLSTDILRVLADDLGALLGTDRVSVYPTEPRFPVAYRIVLDVREFEGTPGESVRLRAHWSVVSAGTAVAVGESDVRRPLTSTSWEELVAAHGAALGVMAREIATRIAALPRE